jgi:hypothetical protein
MHLTVQVYEFRGYIRILCICMSTNHTHILCPIVFTTCTYILMHQYLALYVHRDHGIVQKYQTSIYLFLYIYTFSCSKTCLLVSITRIHLCMSPDIICKHTHAKEFWDLPGVPTCAQQRETYMTNMHLYMYVYRSDLDISLMRQAASALEGNHDFRYVCVHTCTYEIMCNVLEYNTPEISVYTFIMHIVIIKHSYARVYT